VSHKQKTKDILTQCCECRKIKLDDRTWLSENDDKVKYNSLIEQYREEISHDYCPSCQEIARKELGV